MVRRSRNTLRLVGFLATPLALLLLLVVAMDPGSVAYGQRPDNLPARHWRESTTPYGTVVVSTEPWIEYVQGRVIVRVRADLELGTGSGQLERQAPTLRRLMDELGVTKIEPVLSKPLLRRGEGVPSVLTQIYRIEYENPIPLEHVLALLRSDPNVEYAEPDYVARAVRVPNDPEYGQQWSLSTINAPEAWDVSTGSSDVVIALIDSGVDTDHPDLVGRLWVNPGEQANNNQDDDLNGFADDIHGWNVIDDSAVIEDGYGHGTQVAGIVGAATDNGIGIAGICWGCRLMVVKAMQDNGIANYSDIAEAIAYAASNGAHVINLSLGGYAESAMLRDVVQEAATTAVLVGGAGNDDTSVPFYPAAYPEVIAVGATDQSDRKSIFSNYGAWIDVAAPGESMRTTEMGGGYVDDEGTSFSSALVAGLAGLIWSAYPDWSPDQVKWQILNTTSDISDDRLGRGRVDAGAALTIPPAPRAAIVGYAIDGVKEARPAPGQSFQLVVRLHNQWMPAENLQATLSSNDTFATVTDPNGTYGTIGTGKFGVNTDDPFAVSLANNTPYNRSIALSLQLTGDNGYNLSLPITITVRSAVETLGNTTYTADTVWTADKTYILEGSVIVGQGVTLTIQPGTVIKGAPDKFIRVDGTLIAQGTPQAPIVFTSNSVTKTSAFYWGGIRFTPTAQDAQFDGQGNYLGGSILQHVEITYAKTGVTLNDRSPYIADSFFQYNQTAIQVGDTQGKGGIVHIERNRFDRNGYAINLLRGRAFVRENTFISNNFSGVRRSSGVSSTVVEDNVFRENGIAIELSSLGYPDRKNRSIIRRNLLVDNGAGILAGQWVDIEGNLIAGSRNPEGALWLQIFRGNFDTVPSPPSLAYNPNRDEYLVSIVFENRGVGPSYIGLQHLAGDGRPAVAPASWVCAAEEGIPRASSLVYNPDRDEYLLVANKGGKYIFPTPPLCAQRIDATGKPTGTFAVITSTLLYTDTQLQDWQALYVSQHQRYTLLWQTQYYPRRLFVQHLTSDGHPEGVAQAVGSPQGDTLLGGAAYDPVNDRTLVVFQSVSSRLHGAWLSHSPVLTVSTSFTLTQDLGAYLLANPDVAYGGGRYLIVWEQALPPPNTALRSIMGQIRDADGTVLLESTVIVTETRASAPRIAYNSVDQEFLIVWLESAPGGGNRMTQVRARRLALDGTPQGPPIDLRASSNEVSSPQVVYNSARNEYLVAWVDRREGSPMVYGQRLSANGQLLDNPWTPEDEAQPSVNFIPYWPQTVVRHNTITGNQGNGISLEFRHDTPPSLIVSDNNLFGNKGQYEIYVKHGSPGTQNFTINAMYNYWNLPASQIAVRIRDCTFDGNGCNSSSSTLPKVIYDPIRAEPNPRAPAFVRSAGLQPNPVGNQRGTLTVDFSRPMVTTTLPTAVFYDARRGTVEKMLDYPVVMAEDVIGRLWFGSSQSPGVKVYNGRSWDDDIAQLITGTVSAIYGASNGDVWFAHGDGKARLSRLRGTVVITYTAQQIAPNGVVGNVIAIGEDDQGDLWFGTYDGVWRFDGTGWRRYTTQDGLAHNQVTAIARDGQGDMWFLTSGGVSVFDGTQWRTYNRANGLPADTASALFADSQGRIWLGFPPSSPPSPFVGMYDGTNWTFYGANESNGILSLSVTAFAEASDGSIWMRMANNQVVIFDGQAWKTSPLTNVVGKMMIDQRDNVWYMLSSSSGSALFVRWGGLDYTFTGGQWLSPTRLQAEFDFTPQIPSGDYSIQVRDAVGTDDIPAYGEAPNTFQVDFGQPISTLRPYPPQVQAWTDGSLSHIGATWSTPDTDIDRYRYAIGTFPNGRDVLGWTYTTDTQMERNDLRLQQGQKYYVVVQARRESNNRWSADGLSNPVIGGVAPTSSIYLPMVQKDQ